MGPKVEIEIGTAIGIERPKVQHSAGRRFRPQIASIPILIAIWKGVDAAVKLSDIDGLAAD